MSDNIQSEIRQFVVSNFMFGGDGAALTADQSFLETGIVDSTGLLELIAFVEERYGISIDDRELVPENLDSLSRVSQFVARKRDAVAAKG